VQLRKGKIVYGYQCGADGEESLLFYNDERRLWEVGTVYHLRTYPQSELADMRIWGLYLILLASKLVEQKL
jgi:hypothetical protein